jgi:hypothetical protein
MERYSPHPQFFENVWGFESVEEIADALPFRAELFYHQKNKIRIVCSKKYNFTKIWIRNFCNTYLQLNQIVLQIAMQNLPFHNISHRKMKLDGSLALQNGNRILHRP